TDRRYTEQKKAERGIRVDPAAEAQVEDSEHLVCILGGNTRKRVWDVPRSIRVVAILRGAELDFTAARFTASTTYITDFCLFGGVKIRVREGMRTASKAVCIFGGVDNRGGTTLDPNAPLLVVEGVALFGGVDLRVRKTPKERLYEFANQLRTLFD